MTFRKIAHLYDERKLYILCLDIWINYRIHHTLNFVINFIYSPNDHLLLISIFVNIGALYFFYSDVYPVPFDPWVKNNIRIRDPYPELRSRIILTRAYKQFFGLKKFKFFYADAGSGIFLTLDPGSGMEKFESGIRDKHPGFGTLFYNDQHVLVPFSKVAHCLADMGFFCQSQRLCSHQIKEPDSQYLAMCVNQL
jgi:hypothetical protein